ncbi:MAG TPA: rhodanese-like domain-containing protein [Candidatus Acidoferrales bacterium]
MKAMAKISFSEAGGFLTAGFCAITGLLAAVAFIAPATRAQDDLADVDPTAAVARPAPPVVAPDVVLKMVLDKDPGVAIVDTQPTDGYAEGHIPGAISYPWVMRVKVFPISLPRNKTLIMYGSCPHDTEDLIRQLAEFGYTNIKVMDGGWYKWVALKYPAAGSGSDPAQHPAAGQMDSVQNKTEKPITP